MKRLFIALALLALSVEQPAYAFQAATAASATKNAAAAAAAGQRTATSSARVDGVEVKTTVKPVSPAPQAAPAKQEKPKVPVRRTEFHRFCPQGMPPPDELSRRIAASINADSSGRALVAGCRATAIQFLEGFKGARPNLTLADMPRYVRDDLEVTEIDRSVKWVSSCIVGESRGPEAVKKDCVSEFVKPGVKVYKDKVTGAIAIKDDCANPGLVPAQPPPCDYIVFPVRRVGEIRSHHPIYGDAVDDQCYGYQRANVSFLNGQVASVTVGRTWLGMSADCPTCRFRASDRVAAATGTYPRSMSAEITHLPQGYVAVRVSRAHSSDPRWGFGICVEYVDPATGRWDGSYTAIVRSEDYRTLKNGQRVAFVYYSESEMANAGHREDDAGGLYLWP